MSNLDRQIANVKVLVEFKANAELSGEDIPVSTKCQLLEERRQLVAQGIIRVPVSFVGQIWMFNNETGRIESQSSSDLQELLP